LKLIANEDGRTHINVYSNGKTELGRFLSNFSYSPIITEDGKFESIEGYWYWIGCKHPNRDLLRSAYGASAKSLGRNLGSPDWISSEVFKDKIKKAIQIKLESNPQKFSELKSSKLPLAHYYVYAEKIIKVPGANWILEFIDSFRS
jgi:hypothetical protein